MRGVRPTPIVSPQPSQDAQPAYGAQAQHSRSFHTIFTPLSHRCHTNFTPPLLDWEPSQHKALTTRSETRVALVI